MAIFSYVFWFDGKKNRKNGEFSFEELFYDFYLKYFFVKSSLRKMFNSG